MTYTLYINQGIVIRDADLKQVSPAQSMDDPDFLEYNEWAIAGGHPNIDVQEDAVVASRELSKLEFRKRFTLQERMALDGAPDNQSLPADARAAMKTLLTDLSLAENVNLDDPDTVYGVNFLATLGLIDSTRIAVILG